MNKRYGTIHLNVTLLVNWKDGFRFVYMVDMADSSREKYGIFRGSYIAMGYMERC